MPWLVSGWLAGVLLLSLRLLGGWWSTRVLRVVDVSPVPDWCRAQLTALSARMRIARPVAIVSSIRISVPVIVGHVKPVIVLPAAALSGLSASQLEAILAHELAHVRRHDYLVNLAQTVIETLLFYHPAVWWVSRQVRVTREHCCDDLAVTVCRSRQEYVHALLDLEELRASTALLALGATDGSLLARGRRLLAPAHGQPVFGAARGECDRADRGRGRRGQRLVPRGGRPASFDEPPPCAVATRPAPAAAQRERGSTPVVTAPDTSGTLASRWAWAEGAARAAQTANLLGWLHHPAGQDAAPVRPHRWPQHGHGRRNDVQRRPAQQRRARPAVPRTRACRPGRRSAHDEGAVRARCQLAASRR